MATPYREAGITIKRFESEQRLEGKREQERQSKR
jgi:hypothetical protein